MRLADHPCSLFKEILVGFPRLDNKIAISSQCYNIRCNVKVCTYYIREVYQISLVIIVK